MTTPSVCKKFTWNDAVIQCAFADGRTRPIAERHAADGKFVLHDPPDRLTIPKEGLSLFARKMRARALEEIEKPFTPLLSTVFSRLRWFFLGVGRVAQEDPKIALALLMQMSAMCRKHENALPPELRETVRQTLALYITTIVGWQKESDQLAQQLVGHRLVGKNPFDGVADQLFGYEALKKAGETSIPQ